jgi:CheY-like chemotaxis protein
MSEAIWIELIKVLPAFLWVAFGFIALAFAKRLFTAQAPRMTKVETPWVTVELAQQAIEQAGMRGSAAPLTVEAAWPSNLYPLPTQQVPPGTRNDVHGLPISGAVPPQFQPPADEDTEDAVHTEPPPEAEPAPHATPPADAPVEATEPPDLDPHGAVTAPNQQIPNIPPTYPVVAPPPDGGTYLGQAARRPQADFHWNQPLPAAYRQPPAYRPTEADSRRSRRAATRLASAAKVLEGGSILWVDDHPENNESLVFLFQSVGIQVDLVLSTEAAMQALRSNSYDLVISDMGRYNESAGAKAGLALLDRFEEQHILTPVVLYTSGSKAHGASHPRLVAATADPEDVVNYVVDFLGHRQGQQTQRASWFDRLKS